MLVSTMMTEKEVEGAQAHIHEKQLRTLLSFLLASWIHGCVARWRTVKSFRVIFVRFSVGVTLDRFCISTCAGWLLWVFRYVQVHSLLVRKTLMSRSLSTVLDTFHCFCHECSLGVSGPTCERHIRTFLLSVLHFGIFGLSTGRTCAPFESCAHALRESSSSSCAGPPSLRHRS